MLLSAKEQIRNSMVKLLMNDDMLKTKEYLESLSEKERTSQLAKVFAFAAGKTGSEVLRIHPDGSFDVEPEDMVHPNESRELLAII